MLSLTSRSVRKIIHPSLIKGVATRQFPLLHARNLNTHSISLTPSSSHHTSSFIRFYSNTPPAPSSPAVEPVFQSQAATTVGAQQDSVVNAIADNVSNSTQVVADTASAAADSVSAAAGSTFTLNPAYYVSQFIEAIHNIVGTPWWVTIAAATVIIRVSIFPLAIKAMRGTAKIQALQPEMEKIKARAVAQYGGSSEGQLKAMQETSAFMKEKGISPMQTVLPLLTQAPVFMCFFFALRRMAETIPSMKDGGILWFTDLTIPDPYYILPVTTAALFLTTVEIGAETAGQQQGIIMKNIMRVMALVFIPITASFPTALLVYWVTNSAFSIVQTILLKRPGLRRFFNIPLTPTMLAKQNAEKAQSTAGNVFYTQDPRNKSAQQLNDITFKPTTTTTPSSTNSTTGTQATNTEKTQSRRRRR